MKHIPTCMRFSRYVGFHSLCLSRWPCHDHDGLEFFSPFLLCLNGMEWIGVNASPCGEEGGEAVSTSNGFGFSSVSSLPFYHLFWDISRQASGSI